MITTATSVNFSTVGRVGWLEFNRPPVNAFTRQMVEEVRHVIRGALEDDSVRVLVLASGIDKYLSAGADLNAFKGMRSDDMREWVRLCHDIANLLRASPKPLLAAINGTAVGGGLEMTLHCDLRFAADNAKLGQPEIRIGFIPPIATTQALARMLGRSRAIRYLYEGRILDAKEALALGLIDEIVPAASLRDRVQEYGNYLSEQSASALAAIRRTISLGGGMSFEDGMRLELETAAGLADSPDFGEGVDAFLAERKPVRE